MVKIVFFGSGPVAAESLRMLSDDFDIEAVVTKPTTKDEMESVTDEVPVHCVSNKQELDELFATDPFESAVAILIDFGIIVSQKIIDYFPKGIINSHFSLLPELRGADPISFAILEGKETTGVSLMLLVEAMDEGPLISIAEEPIDARETTPSLTKKLIQLSYLLLKDIVPSYVAVKIHEDSGIVPVPRSQEDVAEMLKRPYEPSYTRKLTKSDGKIDWSKSAEQIDREIRAFLDWPKSRARLGEIDCIITESSVLAGESDARPGTLFIHDKQLCVVCGEEGLVLEKIKPAGKKEMDSQSFLAGYRNRLDIK